MILYIIVLVFFCFAFYFLKIEKCLPLTDTKESKFTANLVNEFSENAIKIMNMLTIKNKTQAIIVQLMNELGLTPRGRLSAGKTEKSSPMSIFMQGPLSVDMTR